MASLFQKRLQCFYCGQRSAQKAKGKVRRWRCESCEAVNYLDENGEITDPPTSVTGPAVDESNSNELSYDALDNAQSRLFCRKCTRNQHLLLSALASYFPDPEDPAYAAYEREYPKFRKNLEERYPQVCENCEARVQARIRQAGYEAKADHLRRMMETSKSGRAARKARNRNWRSILVLMGAGGYWASVAGQLAWDLTAALPTDGVVPDVHPNLSLNLMRSCLKDAVQYHHIESDCSLALVPYAGVALTIGILSLWWNPKLRAKIEGKRGRFIGLGQYYQVQLIVLVVRFVAWGLLKDPLSSGMKRSLPPALHLFVAIFTLLTTVVSRRLVRYEDRPLVVWHDSTPSASPGVNEAQQSKGNSDIAAGWTRQTADDSRSPPRFPWEKLASPQQTPDPHPLVPPTPPAEADMMDWTPSLKQEIRPTFESSRNRSVITGSSIFSGSSAPKTSTGIPANVNSQRPAGQVLDSNPFYHASPRSVEQPTVTSRGGSNMRETTFVPAKFYPPADVAATTGLESLFDHAFTIRSPDDEESDRFDLQGGNTSGVHESSAGSLLFHCFRSSLLILSLVLWQASQMRLFSLPGNYVEILSLGSASLIAGFSLLETMKQPIARWHSVDILVSLAELASAVHLGGNLPHIEYAREYFDRYGKSLLIFMSVREALDILSLYRNRLATIRIASTTSQPSSPTAFIADKTSQGGRSSPDFDGRTSFSSSPPNQPMSSYRPPSSFSSVTAAAYARPMSALPSSQGHTSYTSFASRPFQPNSSSFLANSTQSRNNFGSPTKRPDRSSSDHRLLKIENADSDASEDVSGGDDSDTDTLLSSARSTRSIRDMDSSRLQSSFNAPRPGLGTGIRGLSLDDSSASGFQFDGQSFANPNQRRYPSRRN